MTRGPCALSIVLLIAGCPSAPSGAVDAASAPPDAASAPDAAPGRDGGATGDDGGGGGADTGAPGGTLAEEHPGDVGLGADPDVIWFEDFEEGSVALITARYDQVQGSARMALVSDTPSGVGQALALTAGGGTDAVDLYAQLPSSDEWFVRWYARYEGGGVSWHHSGMWLGGYAPAMSYPSPMAGHRPNGDERFSIAIEPAFGIGSAHARLDTYDYWSAMHSWMPSPVQDDGTAYYGNALVHRQDFTVDEGTWICLEAHVRLNTDGASDAGAVLEIWKNDASVARYDDAGPLGYWIRDKFCTAAADGAECTDYPAPFDQHLDQRYRATTALQLNAFWPQNYISDPQTGTLAFDQMVVARRRVGCLRAP